MYSSVACAIFIVGGFGRCTHNTCLETQREAMPELYLCVVGGGRGRKIVAAAGAAAAAAADGAGQICCHKNSFQALNRLLGL